MIPNSYLEKVKQLDDPQLQQGFMVFASDPKNKGSVQELADAPFKEWTRSIDTTYQGLAHVARNGPPPGMIEGLQQQAQINQDPSKRRAAGEMAQTLSSPKFQQEALKSLNQAKQQGFEEKPEMLKDVPSPRGFKNGGLANKGRMGDRYTAHVARGEVVVPNIVLDRNPGLRQGIGAAMLRTGADPARFTIGSGKEQINPETGHAEYFIGAIIGGIIGGAIGGVGAVSAAAMVGIGAAAGNFIETGDVGSSIMWGLGGWGIGTLATNAGYLGAGGWDLAGQAAATSGLGGATNAYVASGAPGTVAGWTSGGEAILGGEMVTQAVAADVAAASGAELGSMFTVADVAAMPAGSMITSTTGTISPSELMAPATTGTGPGISDIARIPSGMGEKAVQEAADKAPKDLPWYKKPVAEEGFFSEMTWGEAAMAGAPMVLGMTGALDAPQPERPAGYDPNDPQQELGYYDFENRVPEPGDISTLPPGAPGTAGNPLSVAYTGPGVTTSGGYSYAPVTTYGAYRPPSGAATLGPYATAWPTMPPYTALRANGGHVRGPGSGKSDSIPARLSDGEFVMTAQAVRGAGKGNLREGARRMYAMMDELERRA